MNKHWTSNLNVILTECRSILHHLLRQLNPVQSSLQTSKRNSTSKTSSSNSSNKPQWFRTRISNQTKLTQCQPQIRATFKCHQALMASPPNNLKRQFQLVRDTTFAIVWCANSLTWWLCNQTETFTKMTISDTPWVGYLWSRAYQFNSCACISFKRTPQRIVGSLPGVPTRRLSH